MTNHPRRLQGGLLGAGLAVGLLVGCGGSHSSSSTTSTAVVPPEPYVPTGFPQVVAVSGTNREMGRQYGLQASAAIMHNLTIFKSKLYDYYTQAVVDKDMQVWEYYIKKHNPKLEEWMDGLQAGLKEKGFSVTHGDLMMVMYYPSELWCRPSAAYPAETGVAAPPSPVPEPDRKGYHSCNSLVANGTMTADGLPLHSIAQMAGPEMSDQVVLLAFPTEGASWVSQTFAGRVNANAAMNSHGFAWSMTAIPAMNSAWGLGESYFHYLAQYTTSPAEAVAYLKATPRGSAVGGFLFSDATGSRAFETHADRYHERVAGDEGETGNYMVQTNHLVDPSLGDINFPPEFGDIGGTNARYDTVSQFLKESAPGAVDWKWTKAVWASNDWYDSATATWHRNEPGTGNTSNDHTSNASFIFKPKDLVAYLNTGTPSGVGLPSKATGEYIKVRLSTSPKTVTYSAEADALSYFWATADALDAARTARVPYLTEDLYLEIKDNLDKSFASYTAGLDRAAYAYLSTDATSQMTLWASALTYYAQAQLYAQMGQSALERARTAPAP